MEDERLDRSGAYDWEPLVDEDREPTPPEFENPAGIGRGDCDDDESQADASCDLEATAQTEDMVMEETKPGIGIDGFEGEEVGGG